MAYEIPMTVQKDQEQGLLQFTRHGPANFTRKANPRNWFTNDRISFLWILS